VVKQAGWAFPVGAQAQGVAIRSNTGESSITLDQINGRIGLLSLFSSSPKIELHLTRPVLSLVRTKTGIQTGFQKSSGEGKAPNFLMTRLVIQRGELRIQDRSIQPAVDWNLTDLSVNAALNPRDKTANWQVEASLKNASGESIGGVASDGSLSADGNWKTQVKLSHHALGSLKPYVLPILGTVPVQGSVQFTADASVSGQMLQAECTLLAKGVVFPTDEATLLGPSGNRLVELLQDENGVIRLQFPVSGKMDGPLDFSGLFGSAVQEALRQTFAKSIQSVLTETVSESVGKLIRETLDSLGR
jgi:hypothetical protein